MSSTAHRRISDSLTPLRSQVLLIVAIPVLFVLMLLVFRATEQWLDWPTTDSERDVAMYIAIGIAVLPVLLYVSTRGFGFLSDRGAQFEATAFWASLKVDFRERAENARNTRQFQMPANITPNTVTDAGANDIVNAVKQASSVPVVTIDLAEGRAWWTTRLLALAAGAVRYGRPETLVFLATMGNIEQTYLGWARAHQVLDALLDYYPMLKVRYYAAVSSTQRELAAEPSVVRPPYTATAQEEELYWNQFDYDPTARFMQSLLVYLGSLEPSYGSESEAALLITSSRLKEILAPCLNRETVDLALPLDEQADKVLGSPAPYVAAVRNGIFAGLVDVDAATRSAVRHLVQSATGPNDDPGGAQAEKR